VRRRVKRNDAVDGLDEVRVDPWAAIMAGKGEAAVDGRRVALQADVDLIEALEEGVERF
jgi:hypothetical protein